jgi:Leucine-rich repeat (LRR) protein
LGLGSNQLTSLPKEIGQLTKLTSLHLSNNNFSETEQERIKNLLPNCDLYF